MLDLITVKFLHSYVTRPMHVLGFAGLLSMGLGIVSLLATIWMKYGYGVTTPMFMTGNPLLLLSVMLELVGVQFISMGLIGELLTRTYFESQGKAPYTVRATLNLDARRKAGGVMGIAACGRLGVCSMRAFIRGVLREVEAKLHIPHLNSFWVTDRPGAAARGAFFRPHGTDSRFPADAQTPAASTVTSTDLNAGVFDAGSVVVGTSTFASGNTSPRCPPDVDRRAPECPTSSPTALRTVTR